MSYDLLILTTGLIRPDIHVQALNTWKNFLTKDLKILWIFNIDFVNIYHTVLTDEQLTDSLKNQCFENTKITLKKLFEDYSIEFKFSTNTKGNFNRAVRNICSITENLLDQIKLGILYLEDDWKFMKAPYNIHYYLKNLNNVIGYKFAFGTNTSNKVSFSPSVWNKNYFKNIVINAFKHQTDMDKDPETIMINYFNTMYANIKDEMICLKDDLLVLDIGRNWIKKIRFKKWDRRAINNELIQYSYIK